MAKSLLTNWTWLRRRQKINRDKNIEVLMGYTYRREVILFSACSKRVNRIKFSEWQHVVHLIQQEQESNSRSKKWSNSEVELKKGFQPKHLCYLWRQNAPKLILLVCEIKTVISYKKTLRECDGVKGSCHFWLM